MTENKHTSEIEILFSNDNFAVVRKPAGWLSVPSRVGLQDSRNCLGTLLQKNLKCKVYPVHRLDEPVQGLILYALNSYAHSQACGWFENGAVRKFYEAITLPHWQQCAQNQNVAAQDSSEFNPKIGEQYVWNCMLSRGKKRAFINEKLGKKSKTIAELNSQTSKFFLWILQPLTGRSHQLRFELYRHGFPILGDVLYNSRDKWGQEGIALQAFKLDFSNCSNALELGLKQVYELPRFVLSARS